MITATPLATTLAFGLTLASTPPATYAPGPAPAPDASVPTPMTPDVEQDANRAEMVGQVGLGFSALGALTLLTVTLPAWRLYTRAIADAEDDPYIVTQDEALRKARTRRTVMYSSAAFGSVLLAAGVAMAIGGYTRRNQLRRGRLSLAPTIAPGHFGAGATLRF
jgi:hypothetical protein